VQVSGDDIEDVLARLRLDPVFRRRVLDDPRAALAAYHLSADDLGRIERQLEIRAAGGTGVAELLGAESTTGRAAPPLADALGIRRAEDDDQQRS
jgi:hypothetical protein